MALCLLAVSFSAYPQDGRGDARGRIVSRPDKAPIVGASLKLVSDGEEIASTVSGADGTFSFEGIPAGDYSVEISAAGFTDERFTMTVETGVAKDIFYVSMVPEDFFEDFGPEYVFYDTDESGFEDVPMVFGASADVFENVTGYDFSSVRFRARGYDNSTRDVYLAGVKLNDAVTGYSNLAYGKTVEGDGESLAYLTDNFSNRGHNKGQTDTEVVKEANFPTGESRFKIDLGEEKTVKFLLIGNSYDYQRKIDYIDEIRFDGDIGVKNVVFNQNYVNRDTSWIFPHSCFVVELEEEVRTRYVEITVSNASEFSLSEVEVYGK